MKKLSPIPLALWAGLLLLTVHCQKESYRFEGKVIEGQYIEANIAGMVKVAQATRGHLSQNVYYYEPAQDTSFFPLDQLNLIRYSEDGREEFHLYASGWRLYERSFPLEMKADKMPADNCQPVQFQYLQHDRRGNILRSGGLVDVVIESWDNEGFMQGRFAGMINTWNGEQLEVTEGRFRIRVFAGDE